MKGFGNIFNRFFSILGARLLVTVISVLSTPIIVRLLGPSGYGNYAVILSIFSLYMIPIRSGVTEGVQKFVSEYRDLEHWQENVIRFYGLVAVAIVLVAVTILIGFTRIGGASTLFGSDFTVYFYLLAGMVFVSQLRSMGYHAALGFSLETISGPLNVAAKFLTVSVGIGLIVLGYGVAGMLLGHIISNILVAVALAVVLARHVSLRAVLGSLPEGFPSRELLSFQALNVLLVLLVTSMFHVDVIMLRGLVGSETTGFYKAALALAEYVWLVPVALQTVLLHSSSSLWSDGRIAEITDIASRLTRYTVLLVLLLAIGLAALAEEFLPLYYGEEFVVATGPLLLLLPGVVGFAAARPLQAISQGSGNMQPLILATGVAAGGNLILNATLIPLFGMLGAAVATSISYGSMFVLLVWTARRIGFDPLYDFRGVRIAVTGLLATPPIMLLAELIETDLVALLVVPPVGALVYGVLAFGTGALDVSEVLELSSKFPKPLASAFDAGASWVDDL